MSNNTIDSEVTSFLKSHDDFELLESGKIRSKTTQHEMPPRIDVLQQYANSAKYKKALDWYLTHDWKQYLPWIIEHKKHPKRLFCTLTRREINKIPTEVQAHVKGKNYQVALQKALAKKERQAKKGHKDDDEEEGSDGGEAPGFWMPGDDSDEENDAAEDPEEQDEQEQEEEEEENEEDEPTNNNNQKAEEEVNEKEEEEQFEVVPKQKFQPEKRKQPQQQPQQQPAVEKKGPAAKILQKKLKRQRM